MIKDLDKSWIEICYWATKKDLEVVQNAFFETGAKGLVTEDGQRPESLMMNESILVKAYFNVSIIEIENIIKNFSLFLKTCELPLREISWQKVKIEDWQENFRKSATTFKIDPDIYIVPSFEIENYKKNPKSDLFIEMDPENAFGTGHHQTTKLCLTALFNELKDKSLLEKEHFSLLDIGTGSGILAILSYKLGLKNITASDNDEEALLTAKRNAKKNDSQITFLKVDDKTLYQKDSFDIIIANILSGVLIDMANNIINAVTPGGIIILSGILLDQVKQVKNAYIGEKIKFIKMSSMDEWCLLIFKKA